MANVCYFGGHFEKKRCKYVKLRKVRCSRGVGCCYRNPRGTQSAEKKKLLLQLSFKSFICRAIFVFGPTVVDLMNLIFFSVQIKSTGEHKIQGLIIQMRSLRSQFSVGQFEMLEHAKLYNCDGKNDTVFYWSDTPKQDVILRWIHHSEDDETLRFV